jgi:hypothetical protein
MGHERRSGPLRLQDCCNGAAELLARCVVVGDYRHRLESRQRCPVGLADCLLATGIRGCRQRQGYCSVGGLLAAVDSHQIAWDTYAEQWKSNACLA